MNKYVVIDLETTGHSPEAGDKIIEVGIVTIKEDTIVDHYSTFLHPGNHIPQFITNLTGITDEDVHDAPLFQEKAKEIWQMFQEGYFIAHNVPFDLGFLNKELTQLGFSEITMPVIDTVELSRILFPQAPSYKLERLADYLNIKHKQPHRALSDAQVTAQLFLILKKKLLSLPYETITHLLRLEKSLDSNIYHLLKERQKQLAFSSSSYSEIISYRGLAIKNIEFVSKEHEDLEMSYGDYLDAIYEENGTLHKYKTNYEKRHGQREMSEHIYDVFQMNKHALIEAGTGIGKSLAYLIPAIYNAVKSNNRILISTHTIQLQTQLLEEEIPLMRKLVPFTFEVALLKGKQHYLSLERFEQALASNENDNYDIILTKAMLLVWITETETGDIDEIHLPTSGYYFYKRISTESEGFVDPASPWFSKSYYQIARTKAQQADILITNHALLCTDMYNEYNFLPAYKKVIIDEAHHLDTIVSRHYGMKLDYVSMQYALNQLGELESGQWITKLLYTYPELKGVFEKNKWNETWANAKFESDELFRSLFQYVLEQQNKSHSVSDIGRIQYKFQGSKEDLSKWNVIKEMTSRLAFYFQDLIKVLSIADPVVQNDSNYYKDDLLAHMQILQSFIEHLEKLLLHDDDSLIKWIEADTNGAQNSTFLYSEPVDISPILADEFFAKKESVVLTSATLSMRHSFSFIQKRLGLSSKETETFKIESPFSYQEQVQLMVPNDFPELDNLDEFIASTAEAILSLAKVTSGRMLVLFTSYDMLRKTYYLLNEIIEMDNDHDLMLIAQGISSGSRTRLKKNFQTFNHSILLGTNSFWEGIDIPGKNLSSLVIVRLPFQPPNHPLYEAKANEYKKEGKSAFFELALPNAVIRFKQGFGRLIRSSEDRGIVFVCDARIIKARYGRFFTESIPEVPILYDSTYELLKRADDWF